ncbi:MAG: GNAT family N-acetyltransferase [Streptosporangiaceae bacterium]
MSTWTAAAVQAAAADWVWIPPDAEQVVTSEYQLIAYPPHFQQPTQVAWSRAARPAGDVVDEVLAHARAWGRETVYWWIRADTRPDDTEAVLQSRGAVLAETVQVLAHELADGLPGLSLADGPQPELVTDERTLRASHLVAAEVWDEHRERTPAVIAGEVAGLREELAAWTSFQIVVFIDGEPAASGGCGIVGEVARLWGAGTRSRFRGRGAYRALLAERMRLAQEHGATLALVKGRVETSGPILRRAGFTAYGEERAYCLAVPPDRGGAG